MRLLLVAALLAGCASSPAPSRPWSPRVYIAGRWIALPDQASEAEARHAIAEAVTDRGATDARILGPLGPITTDPLPAYPPAGEK